MRKRPLFILLILVVAVYFPAGAQTVEEILDEFKKAIAIPTISGSFRVELVSKNGEQREIQARAYQKLVGSKQMNRLFVFEFPPTVRGTGLLLHSYFDGTPNNMWIYLPVVRRVKRIALESSGGGYFMGSDFTYRDLINNDYARMEVTRMDDKVIDEVDHYAIRARGLDQEARQEHGYAYILSFHRKDNLVITRREYYDLSGELLKIYSTEAYLDLDPYIYPTQISMVNVQTDHKSVFIVTDIVTDEVPDRYFTTRFLQNNR